MVTIPYIQDALDCLARTEQTKEVKMASHHLRNAITAAELSEGQKNNFAQSEDIQEARVTDLRMSVGSQGEELLPNYHESMIREHANEAKEFES